VLRKHGIGPVDNDGAGTAFLGKDPASRLEVYGHGIGVEKVLDTKGGTHVRLKICHLDALGCSDLRLYTVTVTSVAPKSAATPRMISSTAPVRAYSMS
jgi:hypothetical protein